MMTPVAAAPGMHLHAIIPFQADVAFMYICPSQKQMIHERVQRSVLMQRQKKLRRRTETSPCDPFDGQLIAASALSFPVLFTDEPPSFDGIRPCGSGIGSMSLSFSFRISSTLFLRMATAIAASALMHCVLFTNELPSFDGIRACGSGIDLMSQSFSFHI